MKKVLIYAGTTEGRELAQELAESVFTVTSVWQRNMADRSWMKRFRRISVFYRAE